MDWDELLSGFEPDEKEAILKALTLLNRTSFYHRLMEKRKEILLGLCLSAAGESESSVDLKRAALEYSVWQQICDSLKSMDSELR